MTYITDNTSTMEITSWAKELPLTKYNISEIMLAKNEEAKKRISNDLLSITSHTILVVDKSGSMKKSDINGHKRRDKAVYYCLAEDYCRP